MEYGYTGEFAVIAVELIGGRVSSGEISLSEKYEKSLNKKLFSIRNKNYSQE